MSGVRGNLKTNKLILQGHGTQGDNITMNVENDEFRMKINDDTLLSVSKNADHTVFDADSTINITTNVNFSENAVVSENLTVEGRLINPQLSSLQTDLTETRGDIGALETEITNTKTDVYKNKEYVTSINTITDIDSLNKKLILKDVDVVKYFPHENSNEFELIDSKFLKETGSSGWGNNEIQNYTTSNYVLSENELSILAKTTTKKYFKVLENQIEFDIFSKSDGLDTQLLFGNVENILQLPVQSEIVITARSYDVSYNGEYHKVKISNDEGNVHIEQYDPNAYSWNTIDNVDLRFLSQYNVDVGDSGYKGNIVFDITTPNDEEVNILEIFSIQQNVYDTNGIIHSRPLNTYVNRGTTNISTDMFTVSSNINKVEIKLKNNRNQFVKGRLALRTEDSYDFSFVNYSSNSYDIVSTYNGNENVLDKFERRVDDDGFLIYDMIIQPSQMGKNVWLTMDFMKNFTDPTVSIDADIMSITIHDGDTLVPLNYNIYNVVDSSRLVYGTDDVAHDELSVNNNEVLSISVDIKLPIPKDANGNVLSNKLPLWPAVWLMGEEILNRSIGWPYCGELDIMEGNSVLYDNYKYNNAFHKFHESFGNHQYESNEIIVTSDVTEYNTYRTDIARIPGGKSYINMYFNGELVSTYNETSINKELWYPYTSKTTLSSTEDKRYIMLFNIAYGGMFTPNTVGYKFDPLFDNATMKVKNLKIERNYISSLLMGKTILPTLPPSHNLVINGYEGNIESVYPRDDDVFTNILNWGQRTDIKESSLNGKSCLKLKNLDYQLFNCNLDLVASKAKYLVIEYLSLQSDHLAISLIDSSRFEKGYSLNVKNNEWSYGIIKLSHFEDEVDLSNILRLKIYGNGVVYVSKLFFTEFEYEDNNFFVFADDLLSDILNDENRFGTFGPGSGTLSLSEVINPYYGPLNTSSKVLKFSETTGVRDWAGFFLRLNENIVFTEGFSTISILIYSPHPEYTVDLKIEDNLLINDPLKMQYETSSNTGDHFDTWVTLTYYIPMEYSGKCNTLTFTTPNNKSREYDTYIDQINIVEDVVIPTTFYVPSSEPDVPNTLGDGSFVVFGNIEHENLNTQGNNVGSTWYPYWGETTSIKFIDSNGSVLWGPETYWADNRETTNGIMKLENFNFKGIVLRGGYGNYGLTNDMSIYNALSIDYFAGSDNITEFQVYIIGPGGEIPYTINEFVPGEWVHIDIPLSHYTEQGFNLSQVQAMKLTVSNNTRMTGNPVMYFDNIHFCQISTTATVKFTVDMNHVPFPNGDYDNVVVNGSWNSWNGWGVILTDDDNDGVFTGSLEIDAGTSFQYVVAVTGSADGWSGWGKQWGDGCTGSNVAVTAGTGGSITHTSLNPEFCP